MGNVIDVSATGDPEAAVLTRRETGGLLGGTFLRSQPLAAYLGEGEQAQYVLRNKKSGLRIGAVDGEPTGGAGERTPEGETHHQPASDYQALAAVTDVRVVFVVGTAEGDRSASIPLSEIVSVDVEDGLLGGELRITTAGDERYVFPCRGDLAPVAEYVDRGADAWARAYTLLEAARNDLETARSAQDDAEFETAIEAIEEGEETLADALDRLATFGEGAEQSLAPEADELADRLERRRREIHVERGIDAHARARTHWGNREYERAHTAYQEAIAALERALELGATGDVAARRERIDDELADLAEAPLSYASAMVEEAEASDDPQRAAHCWAVAVERYRDVYALDWGHEEDRFRGEPGEAREHVLSALERHVECRVEGIERRLETAEWLRRSDDVVGAREVLADATDAIERTQRLVDELTTAEYPALDAAREDVNAAVALLPER